MRQAGTDDLINKRFGAWVVERALGKSMFLCRCDCGRKASVHSYALRHNRSKSCLVCGAVRSGRTRSKHGQTGSKAYREWIKMKTRCKNAEEAGYSRHGGLGVKVHEAWDKDFESFLRDVGLPEDGFSLARINWTGDYAPGNVEWVPVREARARSDRFFKGR